MRIDSPAQIKQERLAHVEWEHETKQKIAYTIYQHTKADADSNWYAAEAVLDQLFVI